MRVNYTLPGFLPSDLVPAESTRAGDNPFRARMQLAPAPTLADWKSLLRLDQPPPAAFAIGPPPRPPSLEAQDAPARRLMWRQMLDRQVVALEENASTGAGPADSNDKRALARMLTLLMRVRDVEGEVASRYLAEAGS